MIAPEKKKQMTLLDSTILKWLERKSKWSHSPVFHARECLQTKFSTELLVWAQIKIINGLGDRIEVGMVMRIQGLQSEQEVQRNEAQRPGKPGRPREEERVREAEPACTAWADMGEVTAEPCRAVTGGGSLTAESWGVNGSSSRSSFSGETWTAGKGLEGEQWSLEGQRAAQRAFLLLHDRTWEFSGGLSEDTAWRYWSLRGMGEVPVRRRAEMEAWKTVSRPEKAPETQPCQEGRCYGGTGWGLAGNPTQREWPRLSSGYKWTASPGTGS